MNKRERHTAIYTMLNRWSDAQVKLAFEYVENGRPIFVGRKEVRVKTVGQGPEGWGL